MNIVSENAKRIATTSKKLGQNFILDMNITHKIASYAHIDQNDVVIEIGPGPGGLTLAILERKPQQLILIEKDHRCLPGLEILAAQHHGNCGVKILNKDALMVVSEELVKVPLTIIIANLPYNIASPLLIQFVHQYRHIKEMVLMFQKEVAQRIVAEPNTKHYGRLSIITQAFFKPTIVYNLPPSVFTPPPKVDSAVVRFLPRVKSGTLSTQNLEHVTQIFFSSRRKTVGHILKKNFKNNPEILEILHPYAHLRPENLSVDLYIQVASTVKN